MEIQDKRNREREGRRIGEYRRFAGHSLLTFSFSPLCPLRPLWFKCLWLTTYVLLAAIFIMAFVISIQADGGAVLWQRKTPSYTVTVFTANTPIQAGVADISVMLEGTGGTGPIMDARVFFELENHAGMILRSEATHKQSANKLLYCNLIDLPEPGHWPMKIIIERNGDKTEVPGHLMVASRQSILFSNGKLIAFPPIIAILFVINQWLRRNRYS